MGRGLKPSWPARRRAGSSEDGEQNGTRRTFGLRGDRVASRFSLGQAARAE